jgi:tRNA A-37 threonylcarbamoyl transferase component Bud32
LRDACAGDSELFDEVHSLLGQDERAERWIPEALDRARSAFPGAGGAGQRLGPYVLIRELGRGGMGSVWLAERSDDQYRKQVAIKLVKPGMDSEEILARFRAERQILASLEHPNIARLVDAGVTAEGLPFLVMDYVEGQPLVEYATERQLDIRARLRIFLELSSAVEHAHQRMVVHRDLKSSNILVTAEGIPKLLDFGIAKVIDVTQSGERTATMARLLTPDYASPEQVRGLPITAASDVYSLGVVLFELLAGSRPYKFETLTPLEIDRVVCQVDAPLPSQRAPQALRRRLAGDLDNITTKALEKDPVRRYGSVAEMRDDIERHLTRQLVRARPATLLYRTGKFVLRNRLAVGLSAVVVLSLLVGLASTLWQARRAEQRFREVRKLAHTFVFDIHDLVAHLPGSTPARERIVQTALEYLDRLSRDAAGDPSLAMELAAAYFKVGNALGDTLNPNLGRYVEANRSYRRSEELLTTLTSRGQGGAEAWRLLASCLLQQSLVASQFGEVGRAGELARKGLDAIGHLPALASEADFETAVRLRWNLAELGFMAGRLAEGFGWLKQVQEAAEQWIASRPSPQARYWIEIIHALSAKYLAQAARFDQAVTHTRQTIELSRALTKDFPENTIYAREASMALFWGCQVLGDPMWLSAGSSAEALPLCEENVRSAELILKSDPQNVRARHDLSLGQEALGSALRERDATNSVANFERALATFRALPREVASAPHYKEDEASMEVGLAWPLTRLRRFSDAARALESARAMFAGLRVEKQETVQNRHMMILERVYAGQLALETGVPDQARAAFAEARDRAAAATRKLPEIRIFTWDLAEAYSGLAAAELAKSNRAVARRAAASSLAIWEAWQPDSAFRQRHLERARRLAAGVSR